MPLRSDLIPWQPRLLDDMRRDTCAAAATPSGSFHATERDTFVYDGSLEGFLTAVFRAFELKVTPFAITTRERLQPSLFGEDVTVDTSLELAARVQAGIEAKLGKQEFRFIIMSFLSDDPGREMTILRYLQLAMRRGKYTYCDHANPIVAAHEALWGYVSQEAHHMVQFARFAEMEGGVYFARINPNANVVPLIMEHFAQRFNVMPFVIYDEGHGIAGVSRDGEWRLVGTDSLSLPEQSEDEKRYRAMWIGFYNAICNEERRNHALRSSWMPKRFWENICEVAGATA